MRDPMTVAFEIRNPFCWRKRYDGKWAMGTLATIWHVDPEKDGTDDSCGWFMRARHGCQETRKRIEGSFEFNWDADYGGWFDKEGKPLMSPMGITIQMFWFAAFEHFDKNPRRAKQFMKQRLYDIIWFAENTCDSLHSSIVGKYGIEPREDRIKKFSAIVYGCILNWTRPWWRAPRWHLHHWKIQILAIQSFKRWAFSRCAACGKRFPWGYAPVSASWHGSGPLWFRSEKNVCHHECHNMKPVCETGTAAH